MKTIMAKTPHDSSFSFSFSFSRRYFHWRSKFEDEEILTINSSHRYCEEEKAGDPNGSAAPKPLPTVATSVLSTKKKQMPVVTVARFRSVLTAFGKNKSRFSSGGLGNRVVGTLFGYRRGHVRFALQEDPKSQPAFLIELATPTSGLVREMASGLVRIALECDKKVVEEKKGVKLLEEPLWRTYCNGKKCGSAVRRECGAEEWKVLKAVEPVSMGAGVLPWNEASGSEGGELMYMRAKFERVVGSRDSEAFYMMNPDSTGGPELSVYLLRV